MKSYMVSKIYARTYGVNAQNYRAG